MPAQKKAKKNFSAAFRTAWMQFSLLFPLLNFIFKEAFMSDVTMARAGIFPLFQPAAKPLSTPFKCQVILRVESSTDSGRIIYSFAILSVEQKT